MDSENSASLEEAAATLALLRTRVLPVDSLGALISNFGSAIRLVNIPGTKRYARRYKEVHRCIGVVSSRDMERARNDIRQWQGKGFQAVTILDDEYPDPLHSVYNPPPLLFVRGAVSAIQGEPSVSVVSWESDGDLLSQSMERDTAEHLLSNGFTVFSALGGGMADAVRRAAAKNGRVTSAVAACGLGEIRTKAELRDQEEILEAGGAVISPFLPDETHAVYTPLVQNKVLSGLSMATIVLDASNARFERKHVEVAMKQGKTVFIAEHLIPKVDWARRCVEEGVYGTNALIFTSPEEITKRWEKTHRPVPPTDGEAINTSDSGTKPDRNLANPRHQERFAASDQNTTPSAHRLG